MNLEKKRVKMASNYWTEGRILMVRMQAGYIRCNDIAKEFLQIQICEQLGTSTMGQNNKKSRCKY